MGPVGKSGGGGKMLPSLETRAADACLSVVSGRPVVVVDSAATGPASGVPPSVVSARVVAVVDAPATVTLAVVGVAAVLAGVWGVVPPPHDDRISKVRARTKTVRFMVSPRAVAVDATRIVNIVADLSHLSSVPHQRD